MGKKGGKTKKEKEENGGRERGEKEKGGKMGREKHAGKKNNLDAICKRYDVDNSNRELHGALLDAEILADVYLAMTGGQVAMLLAAEEVEPKTSSENETEEMLTAVPPRKLRVIRASEEELAAHEAMLEKVQKSSGGEGVWLRESSSLRLLGL